MFGCGKKVENGGCDALRKRVKKSYGGAHEIGRTIRKRERVTALLAGFHKPSRDDETGQSSVGNVPSALSKKNKR